MKYAGERVQFIEEAHSDYVRSPERDDGGGVGEEKVGEEGENEGNGDK